MNAAVWFGAAVFFTIGASPALRSGDVQQLLGPGNYPYFGGVIGQVLAARYFHLQLACSIVALLHLGAEWIYLSKSPRRSWLALLLALFCFALLESIWLQPRVRQFHAVTHAVNLSQEQRDQGRKSLFILQSISQGLNLLATLSLAFYVWRVASQPAPTRFNSVSRFRPL